MSIDQTLVQFELSLANLSDHPATMAVSSRTWWPLAQIVLAGLLLLYLTGWVQDFQRVRDLRAEPSLYPKIIITKNEAWERIHPRRFRPRSWIAAVRPPDREAPGPLDDPSSDARGAILGL